MVIFQVAKVVDDGADFLMKILEKRDGIQYMAWYTIADKKYIVS